MRAIMAVGVISIAALASGGAGSLEVEDVYERVKHGYADNDGVKIHYVTLGEGPLVVMIHGFPDFWYTWRHQMAVLSEDYRVVAMDQRGYNKSGQPKGQENYDMKLLVDDVKAVIHSLDAKKAVIVGHDWGGTVSWNFAWTYPEMTEKLIICNRPHPRGVNRERALNREQKLSTSYARRFQEEGAHLGMTAEGLARRHTDPAVRARYVSAFENSDFEAMLHYYKQNYPHPPYLEDVEPPKPVSAPVLIFHGLKDRALMHQSLNKTWEWLENKMTLVTIPGAGHWVQHDAAGYVSLMMKAWLDIQRGE